MNYIKIVWIFIYLFLLCKDHHKVKVYGKIKLITITIKEKITELILGTEASNIDKT